MHPCQGLAKRGLCVDTGIPVCWMGCWMGCRMGDSSLTAASPGPQTCLESPLCPAEHLTMRISLAPGPPVWRPSFPPDTSPHTGEVSPQGMDWGSYGVSSGSQPRLTTKSIWPAHTRPGFPSSPRTMLHPRAGAVLEHQAFACSQWGSQQHWGAGTGRLTPC